MYNRYIPQPDGSYRRKRIDDPVPPQRPTVHPAEEVSHQIPQEVLTPPCPPPAPQAECHDRQACAKQNGIGFLRQLLPRDCDTGDLIVIALLLLIAGDCETERSNALLTLALYFCM